MKIIEIEQNTDAWLEFRKNRIGASDAPIIMRDSPWVTPMQLWERKLGFAAEQIENAAMAEGKYLEAIARDTFEQVVGYPFPPRVGQHEERYWQIASFDGVSKDGKILEIKCPGNDDHTLASKGIVPAKYEYQLQHQIEVAGVDMAYYYSFDKIGYNLDGTCQGHIICVKRNNDMINDMINEELKFLECLRLCKPPELTDRDFIYRNDESWREAAKRWQFANAHLKIYEDLEKHCRNELLCAAQGNTKGCGVKVQKVIRSGNVDFSAIPELQGIDLDNYRKKATESWRITTDDN